MAEPKPKRQLSRLGRLFGVREAGGDVPVAAAASAGGAQAAEPSGDRSGTTTPEHAVRSPALSPRTSRSAVPPVAALAAALVVTSNRVGLTIDATNVSNTTNCVLVKLITACKYAGRRRVAALATSWSTTNETHPRMKSGASTAVRAAAIT